MENNNNLQRFKHSINVQIRFNDIDIAGHVNNAIYQYYYDSGKLQYLEDVFGKIVAWEKYGFVLLNVNINYINPIYLHDKIEVKTKIEKVGNKSIVIKQIIQEQDSTNENGIKSMSESVMVAYDFTQKQSMEIPEDWKQAILDFENLKQ